MYAGDQAAVYEALGIASPRLRLEHVQFLLAQVRTHTHTLSLSLFLCILMFLPF
jgi:hypothetical protein